MDRLLTVALLAAIAAGVMLAALPETVVAKTHEHLCTILAQKLTVKPITGSFTGFDILYYNCTLGSCSAKVATKSLPGRGGTVYLGPSILVTIMAKHGSVELPPSIIEAVEPGILRFTWSYYGVLNGVAEVSVEAYKIYIIGPRDAVDSLWRSIHRGCSASVKNINSSHSVLVLDCPSNIARKTFIAFESGWPIATRYSMVPGICVARVEKVLKLRVFEAAILITSLLVVAARIKRLL